MTLHRWQGGDAAKLGLALAICIPLSLLLNSSEASAVPYTPPEWQQEIPTHHALAGGQRKHFTWIRDANRDFIDDAIQRRFPLPSQRVNIIVDLNTSLTDPQIQDLLTQFGQIKYIGKTISFVLVDGVPVQVLPLIAALPQVAMIEWQAPVRAMDGISSGAVQSLSSGVYSPKTAQDSGYTGKNVNIAIVDTGVDSTHEAFVGKFVWGYDATLATPMNLGSTPKNNDSDGHGTHVAGIALGNPPTSSNNKCRKYPGQNSVHCRGVAIDARLVDVKVCADVDDCSGLIQGLEWLNTDGQKPNIQVKVVNISLAECSNDDGTATTAQLVNALVRKGMVVVAAHGNASRIVGEDCDPLPFDYVFTPAPGSASLAITVQGSNDRNTVGRANDKLFFDALLGPRKDVNPAGSPQLGLKPDLSAPGDKIWSAQTGTTNQYMEHSGTSMAAPHVAGAVAVVLEKRPQITPADMKNLLKQTADGSRNRTNRRTPPFPAIDPKWVTDFGSGIINVYKAVSAQ